uniref:Citrate synthase n=1 Tax=Alexandrium monilatum TaxID=311494 RepID=A0A6T1EXA6_9DINO
MRTNSWFARPCSGPANPRMPPAYATKGSHQALERSAVACVTTLPKVCSAWTMVKRRAKDALAGAPRPRGPHQELAVVLVSAPRAGGAHGDGQQGSDHPDAVLAEELGHPLLRKTSLGVGGLRHGAVAGLKPQQSERLQQHWVHRLARRRRPRPSRGRGRAAGDVARGPPAAAGGPGPPPPGEPMHPMLLQALALLRLQPRHSAMAKAADSEGGLAKEGVPELFCEDSIWVIGALLAITMRSSSAWRRDEDYGEFLVRAARTGCPGKCQDQLSEDAKASFARLFTMVHAEHTLGSVVTHATALLSSAWCDPFVAYAGGILGFAGPLHGRANQEFVRMLRELRAWHDAAAADARGAPGLPGPSALEEWVSQRLLAGKMVYGFGCKHPYPDPRYVLMLEFARKHALAQHSPLVALAVHLGEELPAVLRRASRAANPYPNPDAISGVLLQECLGVGPETRHPALLAQARAIGALAAAAWHRALGLPIERPQSLWVPLVDA